MNFWLGIAALAALGSALLLLPARRRTPRRSEEAATSDHLRRFAELDSDLASGDVSADVAPALRADIERAVLAALPPDATAAARAASGRALWAIVLGAPALALAIYLHVGSPRVAEFQADHPGLALEDPRASVDLLLNEVRARVAAAPDDRQAWEVLARANMQLGRYDDAIAAAERLQALAPRDPQTLLVLVDALAMRAQGELAGRPLELLDRILEIDPDNVSALVLSGIAREKAGDRPSAVTAWRRALARMPADEPLRAELQAMVDGPRSEAGPPQVVISVKVALAPALAGGVVADDTVFVVARAVGGPAAPLAVSRHRVAELPLTLALDERMAMVPGTSLADFDSVRVIARISRAGRPQASAGDLEGTTAPFNPRQTNAVDVLIDSVVGAPTETP